MTDTPINHDVAGLIENPMPLLREVIAKSDERAGNETRLAAPSYEQALDRDPEWAMNEGSRHFDEQSSVFRALHKIAQRLAELQIP
jgi:hypothetical protein